MPTTKAHRAGSTTLIRTHSRSSSGGSSRLPANLQFTQKDPFPQKFPETSKKNGHVVDSRIGTQYPQRVNSGLRLVQTQSKRSPTPHQRRQLQPGEKPKTGFTIAGPGEDEEEEEEEWVSSESGAATPDKDSDGESDSKSRSHTPVEQPGRKALTPMLEREDQTRPDTPRADMTAITAPITRQPESSTRSSTVIPPTRGPGQVSQPPPQQLLPPTQQSSEQEAMITPPLSPVLSTSPRHHRHHSVHRPPSVRSTASRADHPLRPHPLIRGQSYGQNGQNVVTFPRSGPLAPLTITSGSAAAQISTSPPYQSHSGRSSTSPVSATTLSGGEVIPHRKASISSVFSDPAGPASIKMSKPGHDRNRTTSTMSSSSSTMAVLSSLAQLPSTRLLTSQYISQLPSLNANTNLEAVHPLLPAPFLKSHMSLLPYRAPLRESYDRVYTAKLQQRH